MPATINNLIKHLDRINLEEAILIFDDPQVSNQYTEQVNEDLRLKMVWHVLATTQSTLMVPPALATWLASQAREKAPEAPLTSPILDSNQALEDWIAAIDQVTRLDDTTLLAELDLLQKNHEDIYQNIRNVDDTIFPLPKCPFTPDNLQTISVKLGLNLAKNSLKSEAGKPIVDFRRLVDRLHSLTKAVQNTLCGKTMTHGNDTPFMALAKQDLPHFATLIQAGADPNATVDGLPLYHLTLQPQLVSQSLAFFNALAENSALKLQPDVFDLLLNFDCNREDFDEAVANAVSKCGPFSLTTWQDILKRPDLAPHKGHLAQFAKAMIPLMEDSLKTNHKALANLLKAILDTTLPDVPELAAPWLVLATHLGPLQRKRMAETLTQQATQWNPELFQAALDADLIQLPELDDDGDFVDALLEMKLPELADEDSEGLSFRERRRRMKHPQDKLPRYLKPWLTRMLQAQDDASLCNLIIKALKQGNDSNIRSMLDRLEECKNADFIEKLCNACKQSIPELFLEALEHADAKLIDRLMDMGIIAPTELNDRTLATIIPQMKQENLRQLMEQGLQIGPKCLTCLAEKGRLDTLRNILENKEFMKARDLQLNAEMDGWKDAQHLLATLCVTAASEGQLEVLRYLLPLKPELLTSHDKKGHSLLHSIVRNYCSCREDEGKKAHDYQEGIRLVIREMNDAYRNQNIQVDCVNEESHDGTPLCLATERSNLLAIQVLLEANANPNAGEFSDDGPAILRVREGKIGKCLLQHKANLDVRDENGNYPLLKLDEGIPFKDFKDLLDRTPQSLLRTSNCNGKTILHAYVSIMAALRREDDSTELEQYLDFLPQLITDYDLDINALSSDTRYSEGSTPLGTALKGALPKVAHRLLELGADIRQTNAEGETILFDIVDAFRPPKALPIVKNIVEKHQVDPTQCNYKGQNLLFRLCDPDSRTLFDYVRQLGADISLVDRDGRTLLNQALDDSNVPLMMDLLDWGVKIDATKATARPYRRFTRKLLELGQDKDTSLETFKDLFKKCLDAGLVLDPHTSRHDEPALFTLLDPVTPRTLPLLKFFLDELDIPIIIRDHWGNTFLHELVENAGSSAKELVLPVMDYLLKHQGLHYMVSMKNKAGETLLHAATNRRLNREGTSRIWLWERLCQDNPNLPKVRDKNGNTPFFTWLENQDEDLDPRRREKELDFWLLRKPQNATVNQDRHNALEVLLDAVEDSAPLDLIQKLCQAGFTCHDLKLFAKSPMKHFKWYAENVLNGNHQAILAQLDADLRQHDKNLFTEALKEGNPDLVFLLLDYGYNLWDKLGTKAFLTSLYEGGAPNLNVLEKCFNTWHWNPQILRECDKDENGNAITAIDLLFQTIHNNDSLELLKLLSEKLMPGTYTYTDMLRKLLTQDSWRIDEIVEWLVSNGADPCTMPTIKALEILLRMSQSNTTLLRVMERLEQYAKGRNLPLTSADHDGERTTLLHAAIRNRNTFPLRYLLQKLHIRIEGENEDHLDPLEYAIDQSQDTHLFWLLEAQRQKLTPDYLSRLLCQALQNESDPDSPSMECIRLLVEYAKANPLQRDDRGRIPMALVPKHSYLWNYLNDHCQRA